MNSDADILSDQGDAYSVSYRAGSVTGRNTTGRMNTLPPIKILKQSPSAAQIALFDQNELNKQIEFKMGGKKGIGMMENEWKDIVDQNASRHNQEKMERKVKQAKDQLLMREELNH